MVNFLMMWSLWQEGEVVMF